MRARTTIALSLLLTLALFAALALPGRGPTPTAQAGDAVQLVPLNDGGQFLFWNFGPAQAADVFAPNGVAKVVIAWLFDPTAVLWDSFIPALGVVNFPLADGDVLWVVSDGPGELTIGGDGKPLPPNGDGGTITSDDGLATLTVPPGALPDGVALADISVTALPLAALSDTTLLGYDLQPAGLVLDAPAELVVELGPDSNGDLITVAQRDSAGLQAAQDGDGKHPVNNFDVEIDEDGVVTITVPVGQLNAVLVTTVDFLQELALERVGEAVSGAIFAVQASALLQELTEQVLADLLPSIPTSPDFEIVIVATDWAILSPNSNASTFDFEPVQPRLEDGPAISPGASLFVDRIQATCTEPGDGEIHLTAAGSLNLGPQMEAQGTGDDDDNGDDALNIQAAQWAATWGSLDVDCAEPDGGVIPNSLPGLTPTHEELAQLRQDTSLSITPLEDRGFESMTFTDPTAGGTVVPTDGLLYAYSNSWAIPTIDPEKTPAQLQNFLQRFSASVDQYDTTASATDGLAILLEGIEADALAMDNFSVQIDRNLSIIRVTTVTTSGDNGTSENPTDDTPDFHTRLHIFQVGRFVFTSQVSWFGDAKSNDSFASLAIAIRDAQCDLVDASLMLNPGFPFKGETLEVPECLPVPLGP